LWRRLRESDAPGPRLHDWPVTLPPDWIDYVNQQPERSEAETVRKCAQRGSPYGEETWVRTMAEELGLNSTLQPRGRPVKATGGI